MHMDVIAALAVESVGVEKRAGLWDALKRGGAKVVAKVGAKAAPVAAKASTVASHIPTAPTANAALGAAANASAHAAAPAATAVNAAARAAAPRSFVSRLGRTSAAVGAAGAGAVGVGHWNNSRNEAALSPFESYRQHTDKLNEMTQPLQQQLADAGDDMGRRQALMQQYESGDFGASPWSFGGLNPWAEPGAAAHRSQMQARTSEASNQFGEATKAFSEKQKAINTQIAAMQAKLNGPGLLPQQKQFYQSQVSDLQNVLKSLGTESADAARIRTQAQDAGMVEAGGQFPTPGPAQLGAASVAPTTPAPAPAPAAAPAAPPNSNPLLAGGSSGAPMSSSSFSVAPKW